MPHEDLVDFFREFAPLLVVTALVVAGTVAARWLLLRRSLALDNDRRLPRQLSLFGIVILGILAIILALPVPSSTRNQLLTAAGLIGSGIIALSSTTLVANAMAGLMLRSTRSFRTGDFIRVEKHFGRVTERGLLDTEIQTEDRELTMLPNLYLIQNPVTVVRTSGTLVSVNLSLGYDAHYGVVEPSLLEAAKQAGLEEPFVRLIELGNYSITYRVSGFLTDIKNLLTARSNLCKCVLDALHGQGIEIVSPSFMNQRRLPENGRVIPEPVGEVAPSADATAPEDLMFDKAERAERIEGHQLRLQAELAELEIRFKEASGEEAGQIKEEIARIKKKLSTLIENSKIQVVKPVGVGSASSQVEKNV